MKTYIVVPVHNESKKVVEFLETLKKSKIPVVVVDDGSSDSSVEKIEKARFKYVTLLKHEINLGKGAAIKTGCDHAFGHGADAVILMDADGQHMVSDMDKFIKKLNEGFDVVVGSRNLNLGVPIIRYLGNKIGSVVISLLFGIYVSDLICGYRALTKKAYKKLDLESVGYGIEVETIIKIKRKNLKHCEVPVETIYYDGFKGVSILDAFSIFGQVIAWKFKK